MLAAELLFLVNVSWLLAHELDAIQQREWRFFFARFGLDETQGQRLFIGLHVPLLVFIFANLAVPAFQIGFNLFLLVHAGLHWALRHHPLIEFNSSFSRLWIFGAVPLALLHLLLQSSA